MTHDDHHDVPDLDGLTPSRRGFLKWAGFSVAATMFLPPTLIASIYGMNFHFMPELDKHWGYPVALLAMVISAVLPYAYFRRKGWL